MIASAASTALASGTLARLVFLGTHDEHSLVQRYDQQIAKLRAKIERHLLATPIKDVLQRYDGHEAHCVEVGGVTSTVTGRQRRETGDEGTYARR